MLGGTERHILEFLQKNHLTTIPELNTAMQNDGINGVSVALKKLKDFGYIISVESMGNCYVITQRGMRAVDNE